MQVVLSPLGSLLCGDEPVHRKDVNGHVEKRILLRLSQDLGVRAQPAHFSQQVEVAAIGGQREVQTGLEGRQIQVKWQSWRGVARERVEGGQGGHQGSQIGGGALVTDVEVRRDVGGPVELHGLTANDDELHAMSDEKFDNGNGIGHDEPLPW
jgi:hypothetical protein